MEILPIEAWRNNGGESKLTRKKRAFNPVICRTFILKLFHFEANNCSPIIYEIPLCDYSVSKAKTIMDIKQDRILVYIFLINYDAQQNA